MAFLGFLLKSLAKSRTTGISISLHPACRARASEGETTRIVQLGCGITGLVCAEQLERNSKVDELVLADSRTDAAEQMAKRVKSDKISVAKVDATNQSGLKKLLKGADVLVSSVPWELNRKILKTAMDAGVNYVDFCIVSDSFEQFNDYVAICKDAGLTALTAMGEDPGISDSFARYAANKLDVAEEAHVYDGDSGVAEGYDFFSLWSPVDMLEEATTPAAIFENGKHVYVPPLSKKHVYEFPQPIGPLTVYNTTHEETFLMPAFIKGIKKADFRIAIDDNFARTANMLRKMGMHSLKPVDVKGVLVRPLDVVAAVLPRPVELAGKVKGYAGIVVEVIGEKNGKKTKIKMWTTMSHERAYELCKSNATGYLVGVGGAIATEMLIEGDVKEKGLLVPEQLPAEKFMSHLRSKGLDVNEKTELL